MSQAVAAEEARTVDTLCGAWRIVQLRRGHRFSTDDVLAAWTASHLRPDARRLLDLGAGLGSVGLLTLHRMTGAATLTMVEAQLASHQLARQTVALNILEHRVTPRHGDLRDPAMVPPDEHGSYDLVTCTPPYIPLGKGVVSPHPQRAGARMELRGSVFDYLVTAERALAPDGAVVIAHSASDPRPEEAVAAVGLRMLWRQDVRFRAGRPPTIAVFAAARTGDRQDRPDIVVRDEEGRWTETMAAIRAEMDTPRR